MNTVIFFLALFLCGPSANLKEVESSCGGDIVITIEDVFFRVEPVDPHKSICITNYTGSEMLVQDTDGENVLASYTLVRNQEQFIPANSAIDYREIVIQKQE